MTSATPSFSDRRGFSLILQRLHPPDQSDIDEDGDVCDDDDDGDGVADSSDNCPFYANADQSDLDADGYGDDCDGDDDAVGVADDVDECPATPLSSLFDEDGCSGAQRIEFECGVPSDYSYYKRYRWRGR